MAEVEDRILDYLQQHNFTLAGDALRSEIMARRTLKGALNDPCSSLSEFIANSDNRCSQEGSELWIAGHKLQDRKRLGLAPSSSETTSLLAQAIDQQSPEGKEAQSREGKEAVTGHPTPQGRLQGILLDEKAAAWKGGLQGADEITLSERPVENVRLSMLDSNSKEKSYKQVPQTIIPKVPEGQIQYQGAHRLQHSVAEDLEKGVSKSQRDCDLEANTNFNSNASGFQFTSNSVKTKLPTSNSEILPVLSGDTQLTENGIIRDGYSRSSATHVRLKSGFPFSLSSSSYTPPKYQDPNPSVYKSNGTTKTTHKSEEYDGDPSSSYCKDLEGLSNANNDVSETFSAVVEAELSRPLFKSTSRNANFAHKSHQPQHNMSVDDDSSTSGLVRHAGSKQPFVSQDVIEELPKSVQEDAGGRTTQSDAFVENWGVDPYEDEDPGYYRQVIEDEAWFLAHEIDYPSDDERGRSNVQADHDNRNNYDCNNEGHSCASEELLFSGEDYHKNTATDRDAVTVLHHSEDPLAVKADHGEKSAVVGQFIAEGLDDSISPYHTGMLEREFLTATEGEWYGSKSDVYLNDNDAHFDCDAKNSLSERSSEEDPFNYGGPKAKLIRSSSSQQRFVAAAESRMNFTEHSFMQNDEENNEFLSYYDEARVQKSNSADPLDMEERSRSSLKHEQTVNIRDSKTFCHEDPDFAGFDFNGFSFPSPSSAGELVGSRAESGKSLWSGRDAMTQSEDIDEFGNGASGADDTLASWRRKSGEFSPLASPQDDGLFNMASSTHSTLSVNLFDDSVSEVRDEDIDDAEASIGTKNYFQAATMDRKDREALEEQLQKFQACEEEFETFNLRIVHRKNRTGFEEEKDFPVEINSIIAGRYHVTEYLGSAAFSKAIQAHDLYTGMDVCMKIVKNNKDFFDQSLDEIKLLKYINKHDPADKYHILRLYDYFYHREHLFIVCELLRANLYEFQKYNKESGGEVYFTMPRLQAIARQSLEAVEFLHQLGLIHCDLKPENILIKSYNKCEVKVIDMGSSCFQTDSLCSYVQSRSYRAPEVILGLPYDQKIDIWSLGCILAELCCGNVLFQNESLPTLLARVVGIIGPIDTQMLAEGSDAYKYFTKNHMLYERNQETNRLHYVIPRMTSLEHMLPMGDEGFIEFVRYILQVNPKKRPSAREALNHPWINYSYEPVSG